MKKQLASAHVALCVLRQTHEHQRTPHTGARSSNTLLLAAAERVLTVGLST